jgi:guanine deaminase
VNRKVKNGTTTTCWFATIHLPATKTLFDINATAGARAFVGKVAMDRNSPDYYIEASASASLADTESLIQYCHERDSHNLVKPIITPRFVGTCTPQLMKGLGELAGKYDTHIQSHISESLNEVEWTLSFHPELKTYGGIYDHFGLLTSKTIMAHGCWLVPEEHTMLKKRGVSIAHCPNSNFTLVSGMMDSRGMLESGIKFGLGTDVAGGFSPSMLDAFRCALHTSSAREHLPKLGGETPKPVLSWRESLYLMTQGGADALSIGDRVGTFEVGKEFDAISVDHTVKNSPYDLFDMDTTTSKLEKFLFIGDDRNIMDVYVQGKRIGGSA